MYKYVQPEGAKEGKPDENGVTDAMFEFSWERDVEPQVRVSLFKAISEYVAKRNMEPKKTWGACRYARLIGRTTRTI